MTYDDIRSSFYEATKTDSTKVSDASLTRRVKKAARRCTSLILSADGRWEFDDLNRTDFPIAKFDLASGQNNYSFDATFLKIRRMEASDANSVWRPVRPYDNEDLKDLSITQQQLITGTPYRYDLMGGSFWLWPTPNYNLSAGLKVYFQRAQLDFDYTTSKFTDGTGSINSEPGFNSLYHDLLWLWPAYDHCIMNLPEIAPGFLANIKALEPSLVGDYARRNRDDAPRLTMRTKRFR